MSELKRASAPKECQCVEIVMPVASKNPSRSGSHRETHRRKPQRAEDDRLAVQIREFQKRSDLRDCLLPGMLGRVSRSACEGWQRHAASRSSRFLAKIKLGPCRGCKYFSDDPQPAAVPHR
jgi:hypothetical protein